MTTPVLPRAALSVPVATEDPTPGAAPGDQRELSGAIAAVARAACIALPLLTLWCAFSGWWDAMTRAAGHLLVTVPLVFLYYPAANRQRRPTWLDLAMAALAAAAFGWIVVSQERLMWRMVYVDPLSWPDLLLGVAAVVVVLEATRRIMGWSLIITTLIFLVYALAGPLMPGALAHQGVPLPLLIDHLYLVPEGLFNVITGIMATYLFTFLLFASLLRGAGGDRLIMDVATAVGGRFVGGPAKVAVLSSALMGTVSGSTTANAITTGSITIPLMIRSGFRPLHAAAIETAAGVGGAIMPPVMGAGVFIMAELTGIPLVKIMGYSVLPAILYFGSIYAYVHFKALRLGLSPTGRADRPSLAKTAVRGLHLVAPLGLLVWMLMSGYSPFYASSLAVAALVAVSFVRKETRLTPARVATAFAVTTRGALMLSVTSACAAIVMGVITSTGLMLKITSMTLAVADGSLFICIVLVAVIAFIVGMGLPVTMSYILVSTLAAPALADLGTSLLAAHLIIFWFSQDATITPPLCTTAFVCASIAGSPPMRTGWESFRAAKALYLVPLLFAFSNILSGDLTLMVFDAAAAMAALTLLPAVLEGYFNGPLNAIGRFLLTAAAAAFYSAALTMSMLASLPWLVAGVALTAVVVIAQRRRGLLTASAGL